MVRGEGRQVCEARGSCEQPWAWHRRGRRESRRQQRYPHSGRLVRSSDGSWKGEWEFHPAFGGGASFSFMHVTDVNGDGRNDIVTSNAHDYGILWFEQGEGEKWTKRIIDDSWSQGHAVTLVDLNGDGKLDIVTGKRFMAHNGKDPGERESLGIYWYEQTTVAGKIEWVRHVIDYGGRTGGGMQIPVADLDGDGDLDFAVGGKSGVFLFVNKTKP